MSATMNPAEKRVIVPAFSTNDINGVALAEEYVSTKLFEHVCVFINAGNVAGNITVTLKQAALVDGVNEKALGFAFVWRTTVLGAKTKVAVTSDTFDILAASDDDTMWEIPIDASELDIRNDFVAMRVDLTDPSAAALIGCHYEMLSGRYVGAAADLPSAVTD